MYIDHRKVCQIEKQCLRDGKLPGVRWKPTRGHNERLTVRKVLELRDIHRDSVRRWIRTGRLPTEFSPDGRGSLIRLADPRGVPRRRMAREPKTVEAPVLSESRPPKEVQV